MGFQTQVNLQQAPAVAGNFASGNPRAAVVSSEGAFVAGAAGVNVAAFGWIQSDGVTVLSSGGAGVKPDGFVHREQQALITTYLSEASNVVPQGFPVTLMRTGDYWFKANNLTAVKGQKVFASLTNGSTTTAISGTTIAGYIETDFVVSVGCAANELGVMTL